MKDRRVPVRRIASEISISVGYVETILHDRLNLFKGSTRWIPRAITPEQKFMRKQISQEIPRLYEADQRIFLTAPVTQDKTWVPYFNIESTTESHQWKQPHSAAPKKFRVQQSVGKIIVTIFWDPSGTLLVDLLEHGKTINGDTHPI